jgi:uncharacterized phage protein (TIGR01671 family)
MREHKFRGISAATNSFVYGNLVYVEEAYYIVPYTLEYDSENGREEPRYIPIIPETQGQYTGLKDKTGAEIYEGDIVTLSDEDDEEHFIIEWDENTARFIIIQQSLTYDFDNYYGNNLEVIGNVYEDPELLS